MILVAGGTGRMGTVLVERLLARGCDVRVLTRDPSRASHLSAAGKVDVAIGDVRDGASVVAAMHGVDTVVSAIHGFAGPGGVSPRNVDRDGNFNLIDAAARNGAAVIMTSIVGASARNPIELFRMKYEAEQHLQQSGTPWTIVRATAFAELWIDLLRQTAGKSGAPLIFGRGENPQNFVSVSDVAALADRAISDTATRGAILEIGGPENLTFNELAAEVARSMGRVGNPRHVPRPMLRLMSALLRPVKPELARQAGCAVVMDTAPFTFDASAIHERFPDLPTTMVSAVVAAACRSAIPPYRIT